MLVPQHYMYIDHEDNDSDYIDEKDNNGKG